ncbi:streptavidin-V2-like [Ruditapes philippinarum]|uniref:streptavidin-V2-like n=1 Tax=Ruditapes philippinarum TaxID=129788 RepID=UPI00295B1875|nr:streptavidin-V2-like [Ruditapes philippinarum]
MHSVKQTERYSIMKIQITVAICIIYITLIGLADAKRKKDDCGVAGTWKNQLWSKVTFSCKNGQITGKYNSAVGNAEDYYSLTGRYTRAGTDDNAVVLGWVVSWNNEVFGNSNSSTSWSGIYYPDERIIRTQWLLTRFKARNDYWETTMVNHDEFSPIK